MCGIAGILFTKEKKIDYAGFESALNSLKKRGPDSGGIFEHQNGFLGHRRLSIIDTSSTADQPMYDKSNRYCIVFNGEIFNFQSLKKIHFPQESFATHSDTEVLLKLYIKFKHECLDMLEGFFAFSIYDSIDKTLFIARDRFGKKPLVYFQNEDGFFFASEMKALFHMGLKKELDANSMNLYFQLNYIPQPYSILKNVAKLAPGHYMNISLNGNIKIKKYYNPKVNINTNISYDEACKQLNTLMRESVEKRLISDVPLGAFLSGGIDSSVIVALSSKFTTNLNTFSIGYKNNPVYDETYYANLVAKKYQTNHTVFSLTNNDFLEHVFDVLDYIDEPFADSSAIPVFILSQLTRKHVTVALSGDGGDEVFSGYNKHEAEWRARQNGAINSILKLGYPISKHLPQGRNSKLSNLVRQVNRFAEGVSMDSKERYWKWATFYSDKDLSSLFSSKIEEKIETLKIKEIKDNYISNINDEEFNEVLISDLKLVLAGDMLVKVDMMSMANSLEVRSPFLDHKVVDFAFILPTEYKINKHLKKRIVQDAFRDKLPEELYNRPKHGFEIPLKEWFKNELWSLINEDLLDENFITQQDIFNVDYIKDLKKQLFNSSGTDVTWRIWSLIVFQYWFKKYML